MAKYELKSDIFVGDGRKLTRGSISELQMVNPKEIKSLLDSGAIVSFTMKEVKEVLVDAPKPAAKAAALKSDQKPEGKKEKKE